jgi:hypothetical protein
MLTKALVVWLLFVSLHKSAHSASDPNDASENRFSLSSTMTIVDNSSVANLKYISSEKYDSSQEHYHLPGRGTKFGKSRDNEDDVHRRRRYLRSMKTRSTTPTKTTPHVLPGRGTLFSEIQNV